jgi:hypothetical protein
VTGPLNAHTFEILPGLDSASRNGDVLTVSILDEVTVLVEAVTEV